MLKYFVLAVLLPLTAHADLTIFEVRKNLAMSDHDPVYRDFIINGGSESGLTVGMLITVQRRTPLYDSYQNRSAGDLQLKVARIKIIHVQKGLAVARLHSEFTREGTPLLEDNFIMVGDQLDLSSAGSEKKADHHTNSDNNTAALEIKHTPLASAAAAQIVINTVDLSSHGSKPAEAPTPQKVDLPTLQ